MNRTVLRKIAVLLSLVTAALLTSAPSVAAEGEGTRQAVINLSPETAAKAADELGDYGCLVIHSADRWDALARALGRLGWAKPDGFPLSDVDWGRNLVVCVFDCGDEGNDFSLRALRGDDQSRHVDVLMGHVIYKKRDREIDRCKLILVEVPRSPKVKVTVSTWTPFNGGANATPDKADLEWSATFDGDPTAGNGATGDVVGGLRGRVEPAAPAVKAGEDVLVRFRLESAADCVVRAGAFARGSGPVYVWDGKYSNGYRNHAFFVKGPDGQGRLLRPKEILDWEKNAPHPVEVAPGKSYVLPEWREGEVLKSLKSLGLDTSAPGRYEITGAYAEPAGTVKGEGRPVALWGGELWTNTVVVEVRGGRANP